MKLKRPDTFWCAMNCHSLLVITTDEQHQVFLTEIKQWPQNSLLFLCPGHAKADRVGFTVMVWGGISIK